MPTQMSKMQILFRLYFLPSFVLFFGIFLYGVFYVKIGVERDFEILMPSVRTPNASVEATQVLTPSQTDNLIAPNKSRLYSVKATILNVRSEPSTDSAIRAKLYQSNEIIALEVRGDWVRMDLGWVKMEFLRAL